MTPRYIDAHCHIQFDQYANDSAELIARMRDEGVIGIVVGVDIESSKRAIALAEAHEHLFASVGLHPNHTMELFDEAAYRELAAHPRVVAIGECGLDYFRPADVTEDVKDAQRALFRKHIALASESGKPLIIHARPSKGTQDAYGDLIGLLREGKKAHPDVSGDVHFFVGGREEANELVTLGFSVSYTAVITFARDYDATLRAVPLSHLLSETDAPYVAPASRRGERNDPLAVPEIVRKMADVRGEDEERVRETLLENARRLFSLPI
ncbi:MAG TPA: TatD family hydrolase [Candidatus Paceibacterota bacterium]|nr:TatD family hydrolase [Candidatus Paceibacterota bacterium]